MRWIGWRQTESGCVDRDRRADGAASERDRPVDAERLEQGGEMG